MTIGLLLLCTPCSFYFITVFIFYTHFFYFIVFFYLPYINFHVFIHLNITRLTWFLFTNEWNKMKLKIAPIRFICWFWRKLVDLVQFLADRTVTENYDRPLSSCPFVHLSVWRSPLWRSRSVWGLKVVYHPVPVTALPIHFFRYFAVGLSFSQHTTTQRKNKPPKFPRLG